MRQSIKSLIYQAIANEQWLDIGYTNVKEEKTRYCIGINDVDVDNQLIHCEIFNGYKNNKCIDKPYPIFNDEVKDYELIIKLFESIIKQVPDMESDTIQLSLFE